MWVANPDFVVSYFGYSNGYSTQNFQQILVHIWCEFRICKDLWKKSGSRDEKRRFGKLHDPIFLHWKLSGKWIYFNESLYTSNGIAYDYKTIGTENFVRRNGRGVSDQEHQIRWDYSVLTGDFSNFCFKSQNLKSWIFVNSAICRPIILTLKNHRKSHVVTKIFEIILNIFSEKVGDLREIRQLFEAHAKTILSVSFSNLLMFFYISLTINTFTCNKKSWRKYLFGGRGSARTV